MDNVGKSQHAYLRTYGRRFSTCAMTEDAQLKEHNLRKFDPCVHIEQLVDATSIQTWHLQLRGPKRYLKRKCSSSTGQVINGVKFEISLI